jgi:hypothetical protein
MKTFAALGTAFLFLLLTASVPRLKAQEHENQGDGANREPQDENRLPTARPQQDRSNPSPQPPRANQPDQELSEQERPQPLEATPPRQEEPTPAQTERDQPRPPEAQHGKRIPDDRFRASFGPRHKFRVRREEVINNPRPVITSAGYSFELLEPWPREWSFTDVCYIDYADDQYYLFNPLHAGMRIALIVVSVD